MYNINRCIPSQGAKERRQICLYHLLQFCFVKSLMAEMLLEEMLSANNNPGGKLPLPAGKHPLSQHKHI